MGQWLRRTNIWRKIANPARAPTRLTERSNPATARKQWLALCEDAFHTMKKLAAPMKSLGNLILMTLICIVIFWIFMALRPPHAAKLADLAARLAANDAAVQSVRRRSLQNFIKSFAIRTEPEKCFFAAIAYRAKSSFG